MTNRYIDANEFKGHIDAFIKLEEYYHPYGKHDLIPISEVLDRLEQTPTVDVAPIEHGRWVLMDIYMSGNEKVWSIECSRCYNDYCHHCFTKDEINTPDLDIISNYCPSEEEELPYYCPYCGAKMNEKMERGWEY